MGGGKGRGKGGEEEGEEGRGRGGRKGGQPGLQILEMRGGQRGSGVSQVPSGGNSGVTGAVQTRLPCADSVSCSLWPVAASEDPLAFYSIHLKSPPLQSPALVPASRG